jgi:hypothetical protein
VSISGPCSGWRGPRTTGARGMRRRARGRLAQQHDCPWDASTCAEAAEGGHLEVLQWVRENDATSEAWDESRVHCFAGGPREQEVQVWLDQLSAP